VSASAADLKQEVDKLGAAYAEAVNKQDGAAIATLFAKNGVLVNATGPHSDIAQTEERSFKAGINHLETKTDQVWPLGADMGIGVGEFHLTGKSLSGAPLEFVGRWTAAYVLEGGKWKIQMLSAFPKAQPPANKATIEKLNAAFVSAFNKGDFASVGAMYAEDATALPPGGSMINGRSNIQAFWTQAGQGVSDVKLTTVDVKPLGPDSAREIGTFSLMTKGQQSQQVVGKYVVVWQRVGNDWKLATDIWNMDK
jgi:uncharacterized protein (TIGR02246 family)